MILTRYMLNAIGVVFSSSWIFSALAFNAIAFLPVLPDCWMTIGPFGAEIAFFDLVDVVGTEKLSLIPLVSTTSFVGDFCYFFEPAGWLAPFSIVLRGLALFAALIAASSVAFNAIALPPTFLDWWLPSGPFALALALFAELNRIQGTVVDIRPLKLQAPLRART